ncbi:BrnT family toxin [Candidatus Rariloculus sp.]|uniref:BrnT family toxin n=1 Tax=Candidatus Rariloculus sp. TaxID=3101265 RepID=UPI003D0EED08
MATETAWFASRFRKLSYRRIDARRSTGFWRTSPDRPCGRNFRLRKSVEFHRVITTNISYKRARAFDREDARNQVNIRKRGVSFETAKRIFGGLVLTWLDDRKDYGEVFHVTIGKVDKVAVVVVAHTDRDGRVRPISARPGSRKERQAYYERVR